MTAWFNKKAGTSFHESLEDETMALIGEIIPDWVRLPDQLGGERRPVTGSTMAPCPICQNHTEVQHLQVQGGLGVAECSEHGFVWYKGSV